jgi:hypothetical protein
MGHRLSLLMVEDSETDAELVVLELRRHGYDVALERVDTAPALSAALESRRWDIVVCDHGLPSFDSRQALCTVRESRPDLPFVILSGTIGEEAAVEALKAGARDVVLKTNLARVGPVVDRELREAESRRRLRGAEEALVESEARKTAILDTALDAVISIDHQGRIVDFNPSAETMFGFARDEARARPVSELIIPLSLRQRHHEAFARHLATGQSTIIGTRIELTAMRADGSEFPVELSITRGDLSGRPFFTAYVRDLTERKRAEGERASLEAQLRQSQKMEAIGRFVGGITHDFTNLMSVVGGYSQLLLRDVREDDPRRPNVEEIKAASDRAAELTRQLMAFSRQQALEPKTLDLNAVILGIEPMLRRVLGEDVELVTRLAPDLGPVRADPSQLEQVVMNLAVNARDAMPTGGTLALETRHAGIDRDADEHRGPLAIERGSYSVLSVTDTGAGMDAETQSQIFEPFFTTKEVGKGTGLGLSTVYGIVLQSKGFIRVESDPERGTTFDVYLPLADARADLPQPADPDTPPARGSEAVLLVEDDEALLRLVHQTLEADGYTVLAARDAREAIDICERRHAPIDLAVTDVVMPGMGGLQLARELRARRPDLKLLFMSGYSEHGIGDEERRALNAGLIQKPFSLPGLGRKIRDLLDAT